MNTCVYCGCSTSHFMYCMPCYTNGPEYRAQMAYELKVQSDMLRVAAEMQSVDVKKLAPTSVPVKVEDTYTETEWDLL